MQLTNAAAGKTIYKYVFQLLFSCLVEITGIEVAPLNKYTSALIDCDFVLFWNFCRERFWLFLATFSTIAVLFAENVSGKPGLQCLALCHPTLGQAAASPFTL